MAVAYDPQQSFLANLVYACNNCAPEDAKELGNIAMHAARFLAKYAPDSEDIRILGEAANNAYARQ